MYVVLEEIEGDIARLVPDSAQEPLYVPVTKLPRSYEIGDVFQVEDREGSLEVSLKRDAKETEKRLEANRSKRKRLLKLSQDKKPDKK